MEFKELHFAVTTARELSFSKAAKRLYISQPTLSQSIAKLEKQLGYDIFTRGRSGLEITPRGLRFCETADRMLELKARMDSELEDIAEGRTGQIHFGASEYFSSLLLPRAVPALNEKYPKLQIMVQNETSQILEKLLLDGGLDVAVIVANSYHPDLSYQVLFYEQILLAVSGESPLCSKAAHQEGEELLYLDPCHLADESFILSPVGKRLRSSADDFFSGLGMSPEISVITASIETANRLAAYGVGTAFIPQSFASSQRALPLPQYFRTSPLLSDWTVTIARRKNEPHTDRLIGPFVQALLDSI